ncbi:HAMP domain-containing histidine kinase [Brachybacterium halotolerans subsp. kimchii]|uniref:sensor histidine kinase n=1 Tax=Brachybacterium halotolerans TaxID=2795215 RepID=UPI001E5F1424|nr:HAMP domain-containing sensor histidine kinase [Brachybacterium halotolerans]UEJ82010.1 HAMP domain-containing histidine kinase [Brachybacterium halotolerans subsp. kimchii]
MLSPIDYLLIVATTIVCTGIVMGGAWWALRLNRRGSIVSQTVILLVATVLSIAGTTLAVLVEMYFSAHDLAVLAWVLAVSGLISIAAARLLLGRRVRTSITALADSARRLGNRAGVGTGVGTGGSAGADGSDGTNGSEGTDGAGGPGWREFETLSTELEETSRRLDAARAEIEALDADRRQSIAWISHDLRTPLTGLRAMAEALEAGTADDPTAYARGIRGRVDTLSSMVEDLFELSRLQSGTLVLRRETVELLDLVSDAVADVMPVAQRRGIRIVHRGIEGRVLRADPRELTRALANLLSNGVRHSPDGGEIVVSADVLPGSRLVLSVLDQGPGVASEHIGRIFEVGWREDPARTQSDDLGASGGAGLGLAIVRGIAEAHGGGITAQRVDGGFRLDLVLPAG